MKHGLNKDQRSHVSTTDVKMLIYPNHTVQPFSPPRSRPYCVVCLVLRPSCYHSVALLLAAV